MKDTGLRPWLSVIHPLLGYVGYGGTEHHGGSEEPVAETGVPIEPRDGAWVAEATGCVDLSG